MSRALAYKPAALRVLRHLDPIDAKRVFRALELFADTGYGDVKALKGPLKGRYRLRVGKWRVIFGLPEAGTILVTEIDNRGEAY